MFLFTELFLYIAFNLVWTRGLALSEIYCARKQKQNPWICGAFILFLSCIGSVISYLCNPVFSSSAAAYFRPLFYVIIIALLTALLLGVFRLLPEKQRSSAISYLTTTAVSSALLAVFFLSADTAQTVWGAFLFGLRCGGGYFLAGLMISAAEEQLSSEQIPQSVRGLPALLIYAGVIAMAAACLK